MAIQSRCLKLESNCFPSSQPVHLTHQGLGKNVIEKLRSSYEISSLNDCILQLLYNSLDAGSSAVLIGVNFGQFGVEVYDDGAGLSREDLNLAGER